LELQQHALCGGGAPLLLPLRQPQLLVLLLVCAALPAI
jgi:hypothetical protein